MTQCDGVSLTLHIKIFAAHSLFCWQGCDRKVDVRGSAGPRDGPSGQSRNHRLLHVRKRLSLCSHVHLCNFSSEYTRSSPHEKLLFLIPQFGSSSDIVGQLATSLCPLKTVGGDAVRSRTCGGFTSQSGKTCQKKNVARRNLG